MLLDGWRAGRVWFEGWKVWFEGWRARRVLLESHDAVCPMKYAGRARKRAGKWVGPGSRLGVCG